MRIFRNGLVIAAVMALLVVPLVLVGGDSDKPEPPKVTKKPDPGKSMFDNSLHATTEGMRSAYEAKDGFMAITEIPYDKLGCKNCHVASCDKCHLDKDGDAEVFSVKKAKKSETCLVCHARQKVTMKVDKKKGIKDVHLAAGQGCTDCHGAKDVHGDGIKYNSMRDPGAVKAACTNCHDDVADANKSHKTHMKNVDCTACHVTNTLTCYNCHFDTFLATGKKPGNFIPGKDWLLLVNHEGKVTAGNAQTLVYKGKKFVAYVPYFTHSIMKKGRACADCHDNAAMKLLGEGKNIPVATWKDGKLNPWKGVIPLADGKLDWVYLDKKDGKWLPMEGTKPDMTQYAAHGKPLTEEQLKKLATPQK